MKNKKTFILTLPILVLVFFALFANRANAYSYCDGYVTDVCMTITPDKSSYTPGETMHVTFRATNPNNATLWLKAKVNGTEKDALKIWTQTYNTEYVLDFTAPGSVGTYNIDLRSTTSWPSQWGLNLVGFQDNLSTHKSFSYTVANPTCSSFNYSAWGACSNGTQTRSVTSSLPSGCVGGNPVTSQGCTVPCTGFNYGPWGACVSGVQTRTVTSTIPATCTGGSTAVTSQACTNGCEANICVGMTCNNGIDPYAPGTKATDECVSPTGFIHACSPDGTTLKLDWNNGAPGASFYYLRIDDTTDSWDWSNLSPKDTATGQHFGTTFSRTVVPGVTYNAWLHSGGGSNWSPAVYINNNNGFRCLNNCASTTCDNATCWNGEAEVPGTIPMSYSLPSCRYANSVDCSLVENCGKTNVQTQSGCLALNSCNNQTESAPASICGSSCPTVTTNCQACPLSIQEWKEVAPN